tara:strand:- start:26712 stop:26987 length:276 start_codon:yes stop_codon:yes gene_type:complete
MPLSKSEKEFIKKLGDNIVFIRERKLLKQKELSDLLDMDDGSLRRIESGRTNPTTSTLYNIAKVLDIEVSELFTFDKDKMQHTESNNQKDY